MPDQVPDKIKHKRLIELVRLQKKIAKENNKKMVGKIIDVCYEGIDYNKGLFFGRSQYQSPEIDTICYFKSDEVVDIGAVYKIKIKKVSGYDLVGTRIVAEEESLYEN